MDSIGTKNEVALSVWLTLVACLRLFSAVLGYASPSALKDKLFCRTKVWTDLNARTFAVWTAVTCILTISSACNLHDRTLLLTTFATFVLAFFFFVSELVLYNTVTIRTVAAPLFFSSKHFYWTIEAKCDRYYVTV